MESGGFRVKAGLAEMMKGGVIMDVTTPDQAKMAEEAGACAVMVLERVSADVRKTGGVVRMAAPEKITAVMEAVTIPVMAKVRIGHFIEARILASLKLDYIDESEALTPVDLEQRIDKHAFNVPFICGAYDFAGALRRIAEGAALIRINGDPGAGDIAKVVAVTRAINRDISHLQGMSEQELPALALKLGAPLNLLAETKKLRRLPVMTFAAGGIVTPADAALMVQLGCDGIFIGSGIFLSDNPVKRAKAIVDAMTFYGDPKVLAGVSRGLGDVLSGLGPANS